MLRIRNLSLTPDGDRPEALHRAAAKALGVRNKDVAGLTVVRRSIDARKKNDVRLIYTVDAALAPGAEPAPNGNVGPVPTEGYEPPAPRAAAAKRPVVVGFGPAGMFAALVLAMAGQRPIVLERGAPVEERTEDVRRLREEGVFNPESNVQFGEGGAGTFSDGKLTTGVGGREAGWVPKALVRFGAPERVATDAMPHVGTDVLRGVVRNIRLELERLGGEVRFHSCLRDVLIRDGRVVGAVTDRETIDCDAILLATGHSARDTLLRLEKLGLRLEPKAFSMGVRIEHLQSRVDSAQFGPFAGHPALGPAPYKLSCHLPGGRGVYTFCMCPGGWVMAAAGEAGGVVTNGMSNAAREGANANSALLVGVTPEDFPYPGPLGGMYWQREIERAAFAAGGGNYRAPAQLVGDFLRGLPSSGPKEILPTYRPGVVWTDLHGVLPPLLTAPLAEAIPILGKSLRGFDDPGAVLTAPETRSSSPVRVCRDGTLQSNVRGLYPCGEGAGYAGGIVSAAADGIRCAEAILREIE